MMMCHGITKLPQKTTGSTVNSVSFITKAVSLDNAIQEISLA